MCIQQSQNTLTAGHRRLHGRTGLAEFPDWLKKAGY